MAKNLSREDMKLKIKKIASFLLCTFTVATIMFSGCGSVNPSAVLLNVNKGEMTMSAGLGNFICRMNQAYYDQNYLYYYGPTMWVDDDFALTNEIKNSMLRNMKEIAACNLHAAEYGVSFTAEDEAAVQAVVNEFMSVNSAETLEKMGATSDIVTEYMRLATVYNKVAKAISDKSDVAVSEDEVWQRYVTYAYFDTSVAVDDEGNQIPVTEEMIAAKKEEAEKLSKNFDGELENVSATSGNIHYTKGDETGEIFDADMVKIIDALGEGQVSAPIDGAEGGIFVIKVLQDKDADATAEKLESLKVERKDAAAAEKIDEYVNSMNFDLNDAQWKKIQFTELFIPMQTESDEDEAEVIPAQ